MPPQDPTNAEDNTAAVMCPPFVLDRGNSDSQFSVEDGGECNNNNNNNNGGRSLRPGELERLESRRALRESQARLLVNRRGSFLVQFSKMKGPPQIALLMALLAVGLGSTIGIVPAVMSDRFARLNHGYDGALSCDSYAVENEKPNVCFLGSSDAQAAASVANLINNVLTFLTASVMGSISDEYGRKAPLLIGLVFSMIPSLCLYLLQYIPTMSPWWYYTTSAATGLIPWMAIALSALNDVLPQEFRAPGIGLLFAGFLLGISLSPTLALGLDRKTLCLVSFGVVAMGFVMTAVFIPETLSEDVAAEARCRRIRKQQEQDRRDERSAEGTALGFYFGSPICRGLRRFLGRPFRELSILNRNSFFRLLTGLAFFTGMVQSGDQVLLIYYLEDQLSFNQKDVSIMFLIIGITGILVQVLVMKPLNDRVGEKMVVAVSFVAGTLVNVLYGVAHHKSTIFVALLISGFSTMSFPTISAIKANNVEDNEQGRIQGALYSVKALASGVGPALLQFVYSKTKDGFLFGPGTMFIFAAGLFVIAVGLALALPSEKANTSRRHYNESDGEETDGPDDEQLGEYLRLASDSSDEEDYGSL